MMIENQKLENKTYNVFLSCYNAQDTILSVVKSIQEQSIKPNNIFIFDDNSKDNTVLTLIQLKETYQNIHIIFSNQEHEYDTSRLPKNLNHLILLAERKGLRNTYYDMIMSDDIVLTKSYVERLLKELKEHPEIAIISGNEIGKTIGKRARGAGRLISLEYFKESMFKGIYMEDISFESSLIYDALRNGYDTKCINEIKFKHLRPNGKNHHFKLNIQTMKNIGYSPLYVFSRLVLNIITARDYPRLRAFKMMFEYFQTEQDNIYDENFRKYVSNLQNKQLFDISKNLIISRFTIILYAIVLLFGISKI